MILLGNIEAYCGFKKASQLLLDKYNATETLVSGIKCVEANHSVKTVGYGGRANLLGQVQLDACLVDGTSRKTGAVGAMTTIKHPIETAYHVMQKLPHEALVGEGAETFAKECGQAQETLLTEESQNIWQHKLKQFLTDQEWQQFPNIPLTKLAGLTQDPELVKDTTIMLARDSHQNIAAGGSTSGWAWKYPGRLGDCPIVGAGLYADSRYGAVGCTHQGEMVIRCGTARYIITLLSEGYTLQNAVYQAGKDLKSLEDFFDEGVVIHAIDAHEKSCVLAVNFSTPIFYWQWTPKEGLQKKQAEML